jgi:hypothetical protein
VDCIRRLYTDATSSVKVNGRLHGHFPVRSGVRQGCPLSMVLYTLGLHPFLRLLEQQLPGICVGRSTPVSVVAYADDVTLFLTSAADFQIVENALRLFERASGARVNSQKSTFLQVGPWRTFDTIRGIEYRHKVKILGMSIGSSTQQSVIDTWNQVTGQIKTLAKNAYHRDLCLALIIRFVHTYLLTKIWYVAQLFPATQTIIQQLNTAVTYFI